MTLSRLRRYAACVLWVEVLLRAVIPACGIFAGYMALALFGLGGGWLFAVALTLCVASLVWEASRFHAPTPREADRRIEAVSGLKHRPLAALQDFPVTGGAMGAEIWRAHQMRMTQMLAQARAGWPVPFAVVKDPFSLRAVLLLLLASGLVIAGPDSLNRLGAAFTLPAWPFAGPQVNAWVTPPAYTGQAPILLTPGQKVMTLTGSRITVILNRSADAIRFDGETWRANVLGPKSRRADGVIHASGMLRIGPWWHLLARWEVTAVPPSAPALALNSLALETATLHLGWTVSDAYGLTGLALALRPPGYNHALPEDAALPNGTGKAGATLNLRDSPYAGMTVAVTLRAINLAGMHADTAPRRITLPPPPVHDPTAKVLAMIRQNLALSPELSPAIARWMMRVAKTPPSAISYAADGQLAMLATALATRATHADAAMQRLLALIQQIEAGPDFGPSHAFAQAAQHLLQALKQGPPDADTLNKLLADLQRALAQHLAATQPASPGQRSQSFNSSTLNRMAAQIAADEQAGRMAQAEAELQQLARTLQALQNAQPMTAAQAAQMQTAGEAAQKLTQLVQGQASLLDQTAKGNATPGQQAKLQADLKSMRATLAKAGLPNLPGLDGAGQAMQTAQTALARGNNTDAQSAETSAIQNLQKAASALQNETAQSLSINTNGAMPDQSQNGNDPNGSTEDLTLPGINLPGHNPADTIEQEIIHLDANPQLPAATHDYLHRLLTPDP